ncbi:hypothetical protein LTR51_008611 [Lithohypha guttulata]|nr:hypothetical protein LTR51_008611 [Lithohypha guttulata]
MDKAKIYEKVQERYGLAAKSDDTAYGHRVATAFGYTEEELGSIPTDANLGLSCGNPLALAKLREGEVVIDLGSGAGFDVFLAARKVGSKGRVIGIDMNKVFDHLQHLHSPVSKLNPFLLKDMLRRANENKEKAKADNVSFIESLITNVALPDATADCIISNCVVNLVPGTEKKLVFKEMFRLLTHGGRVAISDILTKRELSQELKSNMALYVGCIAGASQVSDYEQYLREAGFGDVLIVNSMNDLNTYAKAREESRGSQCCGERVEHACCQKAPSCCNDENTASNTISESLNLDFNALAGSFKIYAVKE